MGQTNTEIQSMLNSAMGTLRSINTTSGSTGSSQTNAQFINSVWGLAQQGQTALEGGDEQKAQAITNIVQNILSMISSLGNEKAKAQQEVSQNSKAIDGVSQNAEKSAQTTEEQIKQIMAQVAENTTSISEAIGVLNSLGGENSGLVAEYQKQLDEQLKIIEEQKEILNRPSSPLDDPSIKENALQVLVEAAAVIDGLVASIGEVQKEIEVQNEVVEKSSENISGLLEESATVIQEGVKNQQANAQQVNNEIVKNKTSEVTGQANEKVGETLQETAASSNAIPVVGSVASSELMKKGIDQSMAGNTRINGSKQNLQKANQSLGSIQGDLSNMSSMVGQLNQMGTNALDLVGQYDAKLPALIEATGSWTRVAEVNEEFKQAITDYSSQSGIQVEQSGWSNGFTGFQGMNLSFGFNFNQSEKPAQTNNENKDEVNQEEQTDGDVKFNFEVKKFKESFGI